MSIICLGRNIFQTKLSSQEIFWLGMMSSLQIRILILSLLGLNELGEKSQAKIILGILCTSPNLTLIGLYFLENVFRKSNFRASLRDIFF